MNSPKVSVAMIAYNHERFVEKALESVLAQRTNFEWEIVFGEDCSTDRTREIVQRIAAAHPDRIRLLLPEKNLGMARNFTTTIEACRGDYVALLEGDDFWLDSEKLQMQADLLDAHPELSTSFCRVVKVDEDGAAIDAGTQIKVERSTYTLAHFLAGEFHPSTRSVMFRRGLFGTFPDWYFSLPACDFPLHVLNGQHGGFGLINREMAAYRIHAGGVWTRGFSAKQWSESVAPELQIKRLLATLELQSMARRVLGPEYDPILRPRFVANALGLTGIYWTVRDWQAMRRTLWKAISAQPWRTNCSLLWIAKALLVSHLPFLSRHKV